MSETLWYKDAVIYQAHVRAFLDSTNDGIGDFQGLTSKLDYLQSLGIDTLWLLPFYPSPLRDDGYDIANYEDIHPSYGTLQDFDHFIGEAHRRRLRVITELVINHTSDQHPWFQAARRAPAGSDLRNFYVWSDTNQKYQGVPIIFSDTEKSNWTWDDIAGAYYWHRFFYHQPDLNFDNPEVVEAVMRVMHFWLDRGVDGMRLDAVPYLIEREGTPCANLDETHVILKRIRAEMDARHRDRLLLAEANQWPAEVRPYFGDGDECHMAFNFPLMPRMFVAVRQEDRYPIVEILRQTPDIPETCQWGLFLRNHDELTLEMVTDEERDYMYQTYASDPQMRINGGIRRRLAPLMENSRRRIELMTSLLFSLPGTPVIYYGDELGMGDNIYLGDRNGVRTPMQWTGDRNGGFSRADGARLYAPVVADPVYGYASVNVEAQERSPFSLLNWTRRMIGLRKQHTVFGRGALDFLPSPNRKVLAYVRRYHDETVVCVANLSRSVQPVELDLSSFRGLTPVEMLGQTEFPRISDTPYFLSLGAYAFLWFRLQQAPTTITERTTSDAPAVVQVPALLVGAVWDTLLDSTVRTLIERDVLAPFLVRQPWFQGARPQSPRFADWLVLRRGSDPIFLTIVEADDRQYLLPLAVSPLADAKGIQERTPQAILASVTGARKGLVYDAWYSDRFAELLLEAIGSGQRIATRRGTLTTMQTDAFPLLRRASDVLNISRSPVTPGVPAISFGKQLLMKLLRRVESGIHPEIEVTRHVTESGFTRVPPVAATIEYEGRDGIGASIAMFQPLVEHQTDGWTHALEWLGRFFDQVAVRPAPPPLAKDAIASPPADIREMMGGYLDVAAVIGKRTAELHIVMMTDSTPALAPEPVSREDLDGTVQRAMTHADKTLHALETALDVGKLEQTPDAEADARQLLSSRNVLFDRMRAVAALAPTTWKTRIHGDYRLGQLLLAEGDVYILNIEGHPSWPAGAQREKLSPLRDAAGLMRSLSYAAHAAWLTYAAARPAESAKMHPWAHAWQAWAANTFLHHYFATVGEQIGFVGEAAVRDQLLQFFMLDRAFRELDGELNNRPEWVSIPLRGILELLDVEGQG
jgi:maltose alpha-D-glucosyltransferase/alpha-amylase